MNRLKPMRWLALASVIVMPVTSGCSRGPHNAPVAAEKAREILRTALESWKKGEPSNALEKAQPPIYVNDTEWQSGVVLKDFKFVNDGEAKDAHLYCPVKLTVIQDGREAQREVTYIISTAPNQTVARKVF